MSMPDTLLQNIHTFCSRIPLNLAKNLIDLLRRDSSLWHAVSYTHLTLPTICSV